MKWEELKEAIESAGVTDNTDIEEIDLFFPFDTPEDEPTVSFGADGYVQIFN